MTQHFTGCLSFYNLRDKVRLRCNLISYVHSAFHFAYASANGCREFHLKQHSIAGPYHLLKLTIVNLQKIGVIFTFTTKIDSKNSSALCQRFDLQYPWHYRVTRKMPLEKPFIESDI